jgi:hypothetical protein
MTMCHQLNLVPRTENTEQNFFSPLASKEAGLLTRSANQNHCLHEAVAPLVKKLKDSDGSVLALFSQQTVISPC